MNPVHPLKAFKNIFANFQFHLRIRGALALRILYLCLYYAAWILLRWGDRHTRALRMLKLLKLSDRIVRLKMPDGIQLQIDLYTAYDVLEAVYGRRDYEPIPLFEPKPGQVVLDVGAQQGIYTCRTARKVGPEGAAIAFEPHPGNFQVLSANVARNRLNNVRLIPAALSDREGEVELYLHPHSTNYSLTRKSGQAVQVSCKTLDRTAAELNLRKVDILKIDVEGAAMAVLRGGARLVSRFRPLIVSEIENEEEKREIPIMLKKLDYTVEMSAGYLYAYPSYPRPSV